MFADLSPWSLYTFDLGTYYHPRAGIMRAVMWPLAPGEKPYPFERGIKCYTWVDVDGVPTKQHTLAVNRLVEPDAAWGEAVKANDALWESYLEPVRVEKYKAFRDDYVKYLVEVEKHEEKLHTYYTQMAVFLIKLTAGDRSAVAPKRPVEPSEPTLASY